MDFKMLKLFESRKLRKKSLNLNENKNIQFEKITYFLNFTNYFDD
jgi:hypothetical protein